jgi:phosphatidate phosphatase APP1
MFLKDYGIDEKRLIKSSHDEHKLAAIEAILAFYPGFKFLMIGDNGQRDVEIYTKAIEDYPDRVGAVFIRDVSGSCREGPKADLLAKIEAKGIPTFCGAGFDDAVAVVKTLDLDRPLEAAKAVVEPADAP